MTTIPQGLHDSARAFALKLLDRHSHLHLELEAYQPGHADDHTEPGSLYVVIPATTSRSEEITLTVQSTEALLRSGDRERLFIWPVPEQSLAHEEVLSALAAALA
jgi:hypothetical protein